ncbi:proteasome regulatory particle base subunit rpn10, partial [Dimargaris xerosporica]
MVLEATVIILDNSDWMRNGDYTPTRYAAQKDAVNLIYSAKLQDNPENTVALLAMAGKSPEVLVTLTDEIGHILSGLHKMTLGGSANFESTLQIAQLALKHRANKNQRQRIVAFV